MAGFKIDGRMTVRKLKENFKNEFEGTLRVYDGRELADDKATLAAIRKGEAKGGELVCRASRTVGKFEEEMKEVFGIRVQVASPDDYVLALDGITLANLKNIKKNATKADMEELVAYKRKGSSESEKAENTSDKKKFRIELITKGSYGIEVAPIDTDEYDIEDMSFDEAEEYIMDDSDYIANFTFLDEEQFELKVYNESDEVVYESNDFCDLRFYGSDSDIREEDDFDADADLQNFAEKVGNRYNEELYEIESGTYIAQYHEIKWMKHTFMVEDYEFDADKLIFVGNGKIEGLVHDCLTDARHLYYDYKLLEEEDGDFDYDEYGSALYAVEKDEDGCWSEISEFE